METINVTIKGISPILQHKMSLQQEAQLASKTKKNAGSSKGDSPEEFLYKLNGLICQPSEHIYQAIVKQLANYKIVGRGKKTYKEIGKGSLEILPEYIVHKNQYWEIDSRTVVIPATKGRTVRLRPKINEWELDFQIILHNEQLPIEVVKSALDDVGRESGIGDYRPRFGKFIVTKFEKL